MTLLVSASRLRQVEARARALWQVAGLVAEPPWAMAELGAARLQRGTGPGRFRPGDYSGSLHYASVAKPLQAAERCLHLNYLRQGVLRKQSTDTRTLFGTRQL